MGRLKGYAPPPPQPTPKRTKKDSSSTVLSIVTAFDDLVRDSNILTDGSAEKEFLRFVKCAEDWRRRWAHAEVECQRLQIENTKLNNDLSSKDFKIKQARNIVEDERKRKQIIESERDTLMRQMQVLKEIVLGDAGNGINDETKEKIRNFEKSYANNVSFKQGSQSNLMFPHNSPAKNLDRLVEVSAESILDASDLSCDETCEDSKFRAQNMAPNNAKKNRRSSVNNILEESRNRRRTSARCAAMDGERLVATTTVTVIDGKPHAESVIETAVVDMKKNNEAVMEKFEERAKKSRRSRESRRVTYNDQPMEQEFEPSAPPAPLYDEDDGLLHNSNWIKENRKSLTSPNNHNVPNQSIFSPLTTPGHPVKRTFSNCGSLPNRKHNLVRKKLFKEEDCEPCNGRIKMGRARYKCQECGATAHIDCKDSIPLPCVPAAHTPVKLGHYISDYTPLVPPMIPAILIHCTREIESRGLSELGLYRVSGPEKEVQELLEKFLRNKGPPSLCKYDLGAITSCVKKFLRSLREPLVPQSLWKRFVDASTNPDSTDAEAAIIQCVAELPKPNRDTMAFLILHLQKIAASPETKMCVENLSRIFGPTIVGYSSCIPSAMLSETPLQKEVMAALLNISSDYWKTFINVPDEIPYTCSDIGRKYVVTPEINTLATPGSVRAPSEKKSKKFRALHRQNFFQSPMLS